LGGNDLGMLGSELIRGIEQRQRAQAAHRRRLKEIKTGKPSRVVLAKDIEKKWAEEVANKENVHSANAVDEVKEVKEEQEVVVMIPDQLMPIITPRRTDQGQAKGNPVGRREEMTETRNLKLKGTPITASILLK